jgi:hypothetical protein
MLTLEPSFQKTHSTQLAPSLVLETGRVLEKYSILTAIYTPADGAQLQEHVAQLFRRFMARLGVEPEEAA